MGQYAVTIVIAAALLVFVIYQQLRTRPVNPRQLILPPAILAFLGLANLQSHPLGSSAAAAALGASVATALIFGVVRGFTIEMWWSEPTLLRKGTTLTLVLWIVGIALRVVIGIVARQGGVPISVTTGEIPLFLGLTLASQNLVIWIRAGSTPVPGGRPAT
jgi:hypothetical protein